LHRWFAYLVVVLAGAAVMVLELVGSRLLSPYFGGTTVIWTALIGIIMASLALGYWWGGRLADRRRDQRLLAAILAGAGLWIVGIALAKEVVLSLIASRLQDIRLAACVATVVLFGPASFALAAVGPYVIRLQITEVTGSGATIGRLSAASTGGSIAGTFLAGFVLLATIGHFKILLGLSALLLAAAAACWFGRPAASAVSAALLLLLGGVALETLEAPRPPGSTLDVDSHYERIQVREYRDRGSGRPVRVISTDIYGLQAGIFLDRNDDLVFEFQRFFRILHHFAPGSRSLLTIGGGVGSVAQDFLRRVPRGRVDVVEIDPAFVELGRSHFGLTSDPRMRIFQEDGRTFVRRSTDRYDAVVVDAFGGAGSVPYQLTTEEFVSALRARLNPGGVVVMNVASAIEGERGMLLQALFATYSKLFSSVEVFRLDPRIPPEQPQSLGLVAIHAAASAGVPSFESPDAELADYLSRRFTGPIPEREALSDDFAPVDYYFARAVF
jgi:MFS family permease